MESRTAQAPDRLSFPPRTQLSRKPLFSERLTLEPITARVARKLYAAVEESRSTLLPWLPWVPYNDSEAASLRYAEACEQDFDSGAAIRLTIRVTHEPNVIGVVSLENCIKLHRSGDLGYWLHPAHTGKGYMTEAAGRLLDFAFDEVGFHRVRCAAAIENEKSQNVATRLGFTKEGLARDAERVDGRWVTHVVYSLLHTEWPPAYAATRSASQSSLPPAAESERRP